MRRSVLPPVAARGVAVRRSSGDRAVRVAAADRWGHLGDSTAARAGASVVSATVRALAAAVAGFALTAGLSLVLWALTPDSGSDAGEAVRNGAVAFASAHFLPVTISGTALTLRPLLLTGVMIAVIMTAAGRAQAVRGRALEAVHAGVFTLGYGLGVSALVALAAPPGAARAGLLAPAAVAALGAVLSLSQGATDWRAWWSAAAPEWLRRAVRAAAATVFALISASALVLAVALAASFPEALGIAQLTVQSVGDALGVVLLCLAFLPNAVIAAVGYVSGAGFSVGAAAFSPLAVHTAELPAVPLLAAVPQSQPGPAAWAAVLAPVAAALVGAWTLRRVGASRWQRLAALGVTALAAGVVTAGLAAVGGGGVAGGSWARMGASPLLAGGLVAGVTLLVTASLVVPPGFASLAWRRDSGESGDGAEIRRDAKSGAEIGGVPEEAPGGGYDEARGAGPTPADDRGGPDPGDSDDVPPEDGVIPDAFAVPDVRDEQPDDPLTAAPTESDSDRDAADGDDAAHTGLAQAG